jgi:hypothetical protein
MVDIDPPEVGVMICRSTLMAGAPAVMTGIDPLDAIALVGCDDQS